MITTQEVATLQSGQTIYSNQSLGSDNRPLRARVNGRPQFWKTRPNDFRLPMKHGMFTTFQLTHRNAYEWHINEADALKTYRRHQPLECR